MVCRLFACSKKKSLPYRYNRRLWWVSWLESNKSIACLNQKVDLDFLKAISASKHEAHPNLTAFGDGFYPENFLKILLPIDKHVTIISVSFFKEKIFGPFILVISCQIMLDCEHSIPRHDSKFIYFGEGGQNNNPITILTFVTRWRTFSKFSWFSLLIRKSE